MVTRRRVPHRNVFTSTARRCRRAQRSVYHRSLGHDFTAASRRYCRINEIKYLRVFSFNFLQTIFQYWPRPTAVFVKKRVKFGTCKNSECYLYPNDIRPSLVIVFFLPWNPRSLYISNFHFVFILLQNHDNSKNHEMKQKIKIPMKFLVYQIITNNYLFSLIEWLISPHHYWES